MAFGNLRRAAGQGDAAARLAAAVRERFRLDAGCAVLVSQVECSLPGCPPLETVIAFWTAPERRHHLKVFKQLDAVTADDLPPWWMRDALRAHPGDDLACC